MRTLQRILCADDEPDMRALIKLALENVGHFHVDLCASGRELLDNIDLCKPDIVLLDYIMPAMDGMEVMQQLQRRADCHRIPVVFMTGSSTQSDIDRMKMAGAAGVIAKPFDPMTLSEALVKIWDDVNHE